MDGDTDSREDIHKLVGELKEDMLEIYQYYHGDPPHLQKIFDKWISDEQSSTYPFG